MQTAKSTPARSVAASPYAKQTITKLPNWEGATAWDIWFNNLSIGTFLVAAVGALVSPLTFAPLTRYAYPLALLLLIVDLLLLVSDLGDPLRFHHMLRVFKLSSPMSFGTWSLSGYGVLLGLASVVAVLNWPLFASVQAALVKANVWSLIEGVGRVVAIIGIVPAIGGILYKGVLFSVTSQPGWKDARSFGGYITNSAIVLGCGIVLMLALISEQGTAVATLRMALLALLIVDAILLGVLYRSVAVTLRGRYSLKQRRLLAIAIVAGGIVAPFFVLLQGSLLIIASLLVILSALVVRYAWVFLPRHRSSN